MSSKEASNIMFLAPKVLSSARHVERLVAQSVSLTIFLLSLSSSASDSTSEKDHAGHKKCFTINGGRKSTYSRRRNSSWYHAIRNEDPDLQLFDTVWKFSRKEFDNFFKVVRQYIAKPIKTTKTNDQPELKLWLQFLNNEELFFFFLFILTGSGEEGCRMQRRSFSFGLLIATAS